MNLFAESSFVKTVSNLLIVLRARRPRLTLRTPSFRKHNRVRSGSRKSALLKDLQPEDRKLLSCSFKECGLSEEE